MMQASAVSAAGWRTSSGIARAFYNSITHRYAEGLLNYTRGRVKVLPFKGDLNDKRTVVRTQVVLDDGKLVSIDYAFRKSRSGDWKAYDVIIEGISYVTNYRNHVDAEIRKVGIEQLIKNLETQGEKALETDRKSTRLNSSHHSTSYAVFCLKKK